jgi:hypothetical protein
MKTMKWHAPLDGEPTGGGTTTAVPPANPKTKKLVPVKDNDFGQLCQQVSNRWKDNPDFVLRYTTQAAFDANVGSYNSTLSSKQKTSGDRPALTSQLAAADVSIEKGISAIKGYLKEKYEQDAPAYYAAFGIERYGKSYTFPKDRNKRKNCLDLVVKATEAEGFGSKKYGTPFWTALQSSYSKMLTDAILADGQVSSGVGSKNLLKEELEMVLNSLIHLIKANYPDNYEAELRNWGFQKNKY